MDKESSLDIDDRMDFELAITIQQKNRQKYFIKTYIIESMRNEMNLIV